MKVERNFPLLKYGLSIVTSFQLIHHGKVGGGRVTLQQQNLSNTTSAR